MADISKIQVPGSATQYNIKDAQARRDIEDVKADLGALTEPQRLADGTDLNTVLTPGVYMLHAVNSYQNMPTSDSEHGILEVWHEKLDNDAGRTFQRITYAYKVGRTSAEVWIRSLGGITATWTPWVSVNDTDKLNNSRLITALISIFKDIPYINGDSEKYINEIKSLLEDKNKSLMSISAIYNAGSHTVYPWDTLDSLRDYLTVTAYYDDGTNDTVVDYAIFGSLSAANSIVTVGYLTRTINVTIPVNIDASLAYCITAGTSLSGIDSIDTNVMLSNTNKSVTIVGDVTDAEIATRQRTVIMLSDMASTGNAEYQVYLNTIPKNNDYVKKYSIIALGSAAQASQEFSNIPHRIKFAIIHYANANDSALFLKVDDVVVFNWKQVNGTYAATVQTLFIGARSDGGYNWKGRINLLNVYTRGLTKNDAKSLLGEGA